MSLFDLHEWTGEDGWRLAPAGAAVHLGERLAVVADTHLGYEWSRAAKGDMVPPHSLTELLASLATLLDQATIERLVVAGDLTESPRPCARTARDLQRLGAWLSDRGVELVALPGNHDRDTEGPATLSVAGWEVGHGHQPIRAPRIVIGHHHPAIREAEWSVPCFLAGPSMIVLPAFTANAAGVDVRGLRWPDDPRARGLRCLVAIDGSWLDFGPLDALRAGPG